MLEDAYVVATAFRRLSGDARIDPGEIRTLRTRLEARLFDLFADDSIEAPDRLSFAVDAIYEITQDRRLARLKRAS